jgi:purine-cytosine permease-like protein
MDMEKELIITIIALAYSIIGLKMLNSYSKACYSQNLVPFNGSVLKAVFTSLCCGGITTLIFILSFVGILKEYLGERLKWKRNQKNKKD